MSTSTKIYGRLHYKNGQANAFRHAFWNYLIAKKCFRWKKREDVVLLWAKKITDWHENAFPNRELARKMDLHNNEVGRYIFQKHLFKTENEIIQILKKMAIASIKINADSVLTDFENKMVHIIDE